MVASRYWWAEAMEPYRPQRGSVERITPLALAALTSMVTAIQTLLCQLMLCRYYWAEATALSRQNRGSATPEGTSMAQALAQTTTATAIQTSPSPLGMMGSPPVSSRCC